LAGHVKRKREMRKSNTKFYSKSLNGDENLIDLGVYGRIILTLISKLLGVEVWTGFK
jgi:hypothetical protein